MQPLFLPSIPSQGTAKTIKITDARLKLAEIVDNVRYKQDMVLLVKSGKPAAYVVPVEMVERWKKERANRFAMLRNIQKSITKRFTDEEAMTLALEAQQAVRRKEKRAVVGSAKA